MMLSGTCAGNRSGEEHKEHLRYLSMSKLLDYLLGHNVGKESGVHKI